MLECGSHLRTVALQFGQRALQAAVRRDEIVRLIKGALDDAIPNRGVRVFLRHDGAGDGLPQGLARRLGPQQVRGPAGPVQVPPGDRFGLAGEVVVVGAGRDAGLGSDVLDQDVAQAAIDCQPQRRPAQSLPGLLLLALPQALAGRLRCGHD